MGALLIVMLVTKTPVTWNILLFPFVIVQLYIFCIGLGLFLAQANVFFRDIQYIYNAVNVVWMYLTPIFYPVKMLSKELIYLITHFNPMYFYVSQFRAIVHMGTLPKLDVVIGGVLAAVGSLVVGMWCFMRTKDNFILYI